MTVSNIVLIIFTCIYATSAEGINFIICFRSILTVLNKLPPVLFLCGYVKMFLINQKMIFLNLESDTLKSDPSKVKREDFHDGETDQTTSITFNPQ